MVWFKANFVLCIIVVTWGAAVGTGMLFVNDYVSSAGEEGEPRTMWPEDCNLELAADKSSLLMFMHPRCPCSRASVRELANLMAVVSGHVDARVIFFLPEGESDDWAQTDMWDSAAEIPGVRVMRDIGGKLTEQFGVETSGHVLLYNAEGVLRYSGGITAGRGHEGSNAGRSTVESLLLSQGDVLSSCPVFGCPILGPR